MRSVTPEAHNEPREAVGVFWTTEGLRRAIADLRAAGFNDSEIDLLASERSISGSVGEFCKRIHVSQANVDAPLKSLVRNQHDGTLTHAFSRALCFVGAGGALGAILASAAFFGSGPAVLAAIAVCGGVLSAIVSRTMIQETDKDFLLKQVNQGRLLLFVRTKSAFDELRAAHIMKRHFGFNVRIYDSEG